MRPDIRKMISSLHSASRYVPAKERRDRERPVAQYIPCSSRGSVRGLPQSVTNWVSAVRLRNCAWGIAVQSTDLVGRVVLVVEDEPLIALDLQTVLREAGATVICVSTRDAAQAAEQPDISAAVLDARPGSSEHRPIARRLKRRGIPFLFYATHEPEDVTTVRGSPIVLKPSRPEEIVAAVVKLPVPQRS